MKKRLFALILIFLVGIGGTTTASAIPTAPTNGADRTVQITGADGLNRSLTANGERPTVRSNELGSTAHLQPGDTINLSSDGRQIIITDSAGGALLILSAPELKSSARTLVAAYRSPQFIGGKIIDKPSTECGDHVINGVFMGA